MRNLIGYIIRYHFFLIFLIIETLSVFIIIQHNSYQKSKFINFSQAVSGKIYKRTNNIKNYLSLRKSNEALTKENELLKIELEDIKNRVSIMPDSIIDNTTEKQYAYSRAKIINNSTNKRHNYITIDKGKKHGIENEMAVIANKNIIGVINNISKHYSTAITILNPKLKISAKLKKNNYYGSLSWDGKKPNSCIFNDIPNHVEIQKGDTIVTSGYSSIFPEGLMIGYITDFTIKDGNFYEIKVKLAQDMRNLSDVFIIKNFHKEEIYNLESMNTND